jgi:hypothetical protein
MKKIVLFILLALPLFCFSQKETNEFEFKKNNLYLKLELENRITPYSKFNPVFSEGSSTLTNRDLQNSGLAIGYKLQFFVFKNLSINFGHTFRNETVLFPIERSTTSVSNITEKAIFIDTHFELTYFIKLTKKGKFHFTIGKSFMNGNSDYSETEPFFTSDGELFNWGVSQLDYRFTPMKYEVGYNRKRVEISLGTYFTNGTPYEDFINPTYFPYFKIAYNVLKL